MGKRKRVSNEDSVDTLGRSDDTISYPVRSNGPVDTNATAASVIQVIAGSYERVLHGFTATVPHLASQNSAPVQFEDTFLFNAHISAIRCLALSPLPGAHGDGSQGIYLATGGSDEKVNVYNLSTSPTTKQDQHVSLPTLSNNKVSENPMNRELGAIIQHSSSITALHFPTRSKLLSASEDNTIAISRVRDLTVVSTVKAPNPKIQGQPSGDTSPLGVTPAGVNDFAVHPSMKLMISVGRGEKCMRLWNLVNGKKTGVLNFGKDVLLDIRESKHSSGEGRKIKWNKTGTEFAVAFERGAVIFGADSKPRRKVLPLPLTKLHQMRYIDLPDRANKSAEILAVSTEDGRILFYDTQSTVKADNVDIHTESSISSLKVHAQLGGKEANVSGRIKDFRILPLPAAEGKSSEVVVITANSNGTVKLWLLPQTVFEQSDKNVIPPKIGHAIATYDTGNRITCLEAFVMIPSSEDEPGLSEFESGTDGQEDLSSDSE